MNYNKLLNIAGLIFTLHNTEEAIGFFNFSYPGLPLTPVAMSIAITVVTVIAWIIIIWSKNKVDEVKRDIITVLALIFLINAFIPHISASIVLQQYFPALITSLLLYLPYSVYIISKLYKTYSNRMQFYKVGVTGLGISAIILIIVHLLICLIV